MASRCVLPPRQFDAAVAELLKADRLSEDTLGVLFIPALLQAAPPALVVSGTQLRRSDTSCAVTLRGGMSTGRITQDTCNIVKDHPDVVLLLNAGNAPLLKPLALAGIPTAIHLDGLESKREKWRGAGAKYYRWAERASVKWGVEVIADAQAIADHVQRDLHVRIGATLVERADDYGNAGFISQDVTKEERQSGVRGEIIGNWKYIEVRDKPAEKPAARPPAARDDDDGDGIPF